MENKLWTGEEPEPHELSIAAQICASDEPVLDFAEDAAPFDAETELAKWRAYMRLCAASPMMKERITATVTLNDYGAPVELWCAAFLMTKLRIDERRAWRMPYGLAWWYVQTAHEEFAPRNLWSLHNAFTEVYKGNLLALPKRSQALHSIFDPFAGLNLTVDIKPEPVAV